MQSDANAYAVPVRNPNKPDEPRAETRTNPMSRAQKLANIDRLSRCGDKLRTQMRCCVARGPARYELRSAVS